MAQLINSFAAYEVNDNESILCSLFDEMLAPLLPKVLQNPINDENSPELVPYVIELFGK